MIIPHCNICKGKAIYWGCVDINKSAEEINNTFLPYAGQAIYYKKCEECGHIFSTDFDKWSKQDFRDRIYNDDYIKVDPEYDGTRSRRDVQWFKQFCPDKQYKIIDYGAGNQVFGDELNKIGYQVTSWDPMWGTDKPNEQFDIMTAFEVLEHTPTPIETVSEMISLLKPNGQIVFSTYVNDVLQNKRNPMFWYLAPRNGHVCMYSYKSLEVLFGMFGYKVKHLGESVHIAHK